MQSIKQLCYFVNDAVYGIERIGRSLAVTLLHAADVTTYIVASTTSPNSLFAPIAAGFIVILAPLRKQIQNPKFAAPFGYSINWRNFIFFMHCWTGPFRMQAKLIRQIKYIRGEDDSSRGLSLGLRRHFAVVATK
jgi:hypothetical protein